MRQTSCLRWPATNEITTMKSSLLTAVPRTLLGLIFLVGAIAVIVLFHALLNPGGILLVLTFVATGGLLAYQCRSNLLSLAQFPAKCDA